MIQEKSCGAVLFREEGERRYLVLDSVLGHTGLCKGHVEGQETEEETARREILEETGLTVTFVEGFRRVITYSPAPGRMKDVVFFLAQADPGEPVCQPEEVRTLRFLPYEEARAAMTYDSDRSVLDGAEEFLRGS